MLQVYITFGMGIPFFWVTIVSLALAIGRKDRFGIPGSDEVRLLGSWRCTGWGPVKSCSDSARVCFEHFKLCSCHTFTGPFFLEENYAITFPIPFWCWTAHRVTQANFYQQRHWPSLHSWSDPVPTCAALLVTGVPLGPTTRCELFLLPRCPDSCLDMVGT